MIHLMAPSSRSFRCLFDCRKTCGSEPSGSPVAPRCAVLPQELAKDDHVAIRGNVVSFRSLTSVKLFTEFSNFLDLFTIWTESDDLYTSKNSNLTKRFSLRCSAAQPGLTGPSRDRTKSRAKTKPAGRAKQSPLQAAWYHTLPHSRSTQEIRRLRDQFRASWCCKGHWIFATCLQIIFNLNFRFHVLPNFLKIRNIRNSQYLGPDKKPKVWCSAEVLCDLQAWRFAQPQDPENKVLTKNQTSHMGSAWRCSSATLGDKIRRKTRHSEIYRNISARQKVDLGGCIYI